MANDSVSIRVASDEDLEQVLARLGVEDEHDVGGFSVHQPTIRGGHAQGHVTVALLHEVPCGFLVRNDRTADIDLLGVWNEHRGKGIGRALVEDAISRLPDNVVVEVQCEPKTSVPFWQKIGFEPLSNHPLARDTTDDVYMVRLTPEAGPQGLKYDHQIVFRFFRPEFAKEADEVVSELEIPAARVEERFVLEEMALLYSNTRDTRASIAVDGQEVYPKARLKDLGFGTKKYSVWRCTEVPATPPVPKAARPWEPLPFRVDLTKLRG